MPGALAVAADGTVFVTYSTRSGTGSSTYVVTHRPGDSPGTHRAPAVIATGRSVCRLPESVVREIRGDGRSDRSARRVADHTGRHERQRLADLGVGPPRRCDHRPDRDRPRWHPRPPDHLLPAHRRRPGALTDQRRHDDAHLGQSDQRSYYESPIAFRGRGSSTTRTSAARRRPGRAMLHIEWGDGAGDWSSPIASDAVSVDSGALAAVPPGRP